MKFQFVTALILGVLTFCGSRLLAQVDVNVNPSTPSRGANVDVNAPGTNIDVNSPTLDPAQRDAVRDQRQNNREERIDQRQQRRDNIQGQRDNRQDLRDNRDDVRDNRQQVRDNRQDNRQDRRDDRADNRWRYRYHNGEWWYWMPANHWMYYRDNNWSKYDANSFRNSNRYSTGYRGVNRGAATATSPQGKEHVQGIQSQPLNPTPQLNLNSGAGVSPNIDTTIGGGVGAQNGAARGAEIGGTAGQRP